MDFTGHAYLFNGTFSQWQTRLKEFMAAFSEPDRRVFSEAGQGPWRIAHIRAIIAWASLTPYMSDRKIALVPEAERLTGEAADAFLKTLEEPPARTLLFLFTEFPGSLPPTVRSRLIMVNAELAVPRAGAAAKREFYDMLAAPFTLRLTRAADWAKEPEELLKLLGGWLLALREDLLGQTLPPEIARTRALDIMAKMLRAVRTLRVTSANPRLLLDSLLLSC